MKKFFLIIMAVILSCVSPSNDSIFVEDIPNNLIDDENRYDRDNIIYTIGREFLYKFSLTKKGVAIKSEIHYISLKVLGTTKPFSKFDPDYNQTVIEYSYINEEGVVLSKEKTGVIENKNNIWIHPPRSLDAGILQLSAFPYIKFGNKKKWKWNLEASFEGYQNVNLINNYRKKRSFIYESEYLGSLQCADIKGLTNSEIGSTSSNFIFNTYYGFVLLEFINIDNTAIRLTLIK